MLPPRFELGSRANPALTEYRPAALPIELRGQKNIMGPVRLEITIRGLKGRCLIQLGHRPSSREIRGKTHVSRMNMACGIRTRRLRIENPTC
jgi:hypothetical protein